MTKTLTLDMVYRNIDAWRAQLQARGGCQDQVSAAALRTVLAWIEKIGDDVPDTWGYLEHEDDEEWGEDSAQQALERGPR